MSFPSTNDNFLGTTAQGTSTLTSPDHSLDHRALGSNLGGVIGNLGTNGGSGILNAFTSSDKAVRHQSGTFQIAHQGTFNNSLLAGGTANALNLGTVVAKGFYNNNNLGTLGTVNWANGDVQIGTNNATGTIVYTNAVAGQRLTLAMYQDGSGGHGITLPSSKAPYGNVPSFGTSASAINMIVVFYDGANYLTQYAPSFS